jgi:hypothetical protein
LIFQIVRIIDEVGVGSKVSKVKVKVCSKNGDDELNMGVNWP